MKKLVLILLISVFGYILFGCATTTSSNLLNYKHQWKGFSYDEVFDAAMYALNNNGEVIVESNRSSGTIHTRLKINGISEGDNYYLITKSKNAIWYSASFNLICEEGDENIYIDKVNSDEWKRCVDDAVNQITVEQLTDPWEREIYNKLKKDDVVEVIVPRTKHITGNWSAYQENIVEHISEALKNLNGSE